MTDFQNQVIRSEETVIARTAPLHPTGISHTKEGDILVTLRDNNSNFDINPSSRRLVQRMTLTGNVLHTYEFQEDNKRLFTLPAKTIENGNLDVCVVNRLSAYWGEVVILNRHADDVIRYKGLNPHKFSPLDIACDSSNRIIVSDIYRKYKSLHLLSPDGEFLHFLIIDTAHRPSCVTLYEKKEEI